jgi:hypothetical protein
MHQPANKMYPLSLSSHSAPFQPPDIYNTPNAFCPFQLPMIECSTRATCPCRVSSHCLECEFLHFKCLKRFHFRRTFCVTDDAGTPPPFHRTSPAVHSRWPLSLDTVAGCCAQYRDGTGVHIRDEILPKAPNIQKIQININIDFYQPIYM